MSATTALSYGQRIPAAIPQKMAQSFLVTGAIQILVGGASTQLAVTWGSLAAVITLVEAVTRPLIQSIFPEHQFIGGCIQFGALPLIVRTFAASYIPQLSTRLQTGVVSFIAWYALNATDHQDVDQAMVWTY